MSYTHFPEPIECPECGLSTNELYHQDKVLKCENCWGEEAVQELEDK